MAFVHRQSCEGVKSELDLFGVPPTQTSIEDAQWVEHQPMASLESGGPIEFLLPGSGDTYLDLASSYLHVQAKVTKGNGTPLDPDNAVAPVNNWLHSLFSQVDVYLNGTLVTPSQRGQRNSTDESTVVQRHRQSHGRRQHCRRGRNDPRVGVSASAR